MTVILKFLVYNVPGVLDRIAGLIRRNGLNIDSISAAPVDDGLTRIDILMSEEILDSQALKKQIAALDFVQRWEVCDSGVYMLRELLVFKIAKENYAQNPEKSERVILEEEGYLTVEKTGAPAEIDAFIREKNREFMEYMRSGAIAIERKGAGQHEGQ